MVPLTSQLHTKTPPRARHRKSDATPRWQLDPAQFAWAIGSLCALSRVPFDAELLLKQFPPPYTTDTLLRASRGLGFRIWLKHHDLAQPSGIATPCLALLAPALDEKAPQPGNDTRTQPPPALPGAHLGLITDVTPARIQYFEAGTNTPLEAPPRLFAQHYLGVVFFVTRKRQPFIDPDAVGGTTRFGFRWFLPALLKHKKVWRDVLLASLVMQLLALGTPCTGGGERDRRGASCQEA